MLLMIIIIIQFYIIYVPSQQLQGQIQHSVDTGNHSKDKLNIKIRGKLQASTRERNILVQKK
jgi:hypothetical protein